MTVVHSYSSKFILKCL